MIICIDLNMLNVCLVKDCLWIVMGIIVDIVNRNIVIEFVDEEVFYCIVVMEGIKGYYYKWVDEDNKEGFFLFYKCLIKQIVDIIYELNFKFFYLKVLVSMLIEMVNSNLYFVRYLFRFIDLSGEGVDFFDKVIKMLEFFVYYFIL